MAGVFVYLLPFISQILDFIYRMVSIFILIYFEWRAWHWKPAIFAHVPEHPYWVVYHLLSRLSEQTLNENSLMQKDKRGAKKSVAEDRHLLIDRTIFHVGQPKIQAKFEHGLDQREKRKRFSWSYVAEGDVPDSQILRIDWKSDIHSGLSMKYTDSSKNKTRTTDIRPWQKRFKRGLRHPTGLSRESWKQQNAHQWISSLRCSRSHFFCYWMIKSVMQSYVKWKKKKTNCAVVT